MTNYDHRVKEKESPYPHYYYYKIILLDILTNHRSHVDFHPIRANSIIQTDSL